jgi:hypothetical protein
MRNKISSTGDLYSVTQQIENAKDVYWEALEIYLALADENRPADQSDVVMKLALLYGYI